MARSVKTRAEDEALLARLDMRHNEGLTVQQISDRTGVTYGTIVGQFREVRIASEKHGCQAERPENKDESQARFWWKRRVAK